MKSAGVSKTSRRNKVKEPPQQQNNKKWNKIQISHFNIKQKQHPERYSITTGRTFSTEPKKYK
jgi:hypothetical protein